jgi:hypothetical protein
MSDFRSRSHFFGRWQAAGKNGFIGRLLYSESEKSRVDIGDLNGRPVGTRTPDLVRVKDAL